VPIATIRVQNFRAFADSGELEFGQLTAIVGRNDAGKSGLIHALDVFFNPPKKGGLDLNDIHKKDTNEKAVIEIAFHPDKLRQPLIQLDAKNRIHVVDDRVVDSAGLLRVRATFSTKGKESFELLIQDTDDDDLFPLCLKGHDELLALLDARGLPAVRAGKETNEEKRVALRQHAEAKGTAMREAWVEAGSAEKAVREALPEFIFFSDSPKLAIGETPVQNQFKGVVERALAAHEGAQALEDAIRGTVQGEFDKLYDKLTRLTDTVTGLRAEPKVSWKKAVDGISLWWSDATGIDLPYERRGAGVRRLFMVAYFQYEAAASLHEVDGPRYVFAIEEPEVHLHPGAQRDLEEALHDLGDLNHSVVFSTHSPVFASSTSAEHLVLVRRAGVSATAEQPPAVAPEDVAHELGVEASDRLVGKNHVVLVEGPGDVEFYTAVLQELHSGNHTQLDPADILFLQCGGNGNLRFVVTTNCIDDAGLKWCVLVDSDRASAGGPPGPETQRIQSSCPKTCLAFRHLERTAIENYLDSGAIKAVTGVECRVPAHGRLTDSSGAPLAKADYKKVKSSVGAIAHHMGAPTLLQCSTGKSGKSEWLEIFEGIRSCFGL